MSPTASLPRMRASLLCLLLALAACEPKQAKPPTAPHPPASPDAVALVEGHKLDKTFVLVTARYLPRPAQSAQSLVSEAMFACLERADTHELAQSVAHAFDAGMSKEEIAGALEFFHTAHGKKLADNDWVRVINENVTGSARVAVEMSADESAQAEAFSASPQHAKFLATGQAVADSSEHDSLARSVVEKCDKTIK